MKKGAVQLHEVQFVSFYIGEALYGLDIRFVKEVNTNTAITLVPLTSPHIQGLVNIRGQIVLVIDSSVLFGGNEHRISPDSHLVILKTAAEFEQCEESGSLVTMNQLPDKPVALLVDRIGDVITISRDQVGKSPPHIHAERARFVRSVVKTDQLFLIELDPEQLIAGDCAVDETKKTQSL